MVIRANNNLVERAYQLWEKADSEEPWPITKQKIISQLFLETKQKNPWMSWLYSFIDCFFPKWMERKVNKAFAAYKFDLVQSGKYASRTHLFSYKEKWFIDQKLIGVFKNIIGKRVPEDLQKKAARWRSKVNKYYKKREFMIGSYILFQIGQKLPNFRKKLDWVKALNLGYIEKECKETFANMDDDAIVRGLTHYLAKPFDESKSLFRMFAEISYHVSKEKAKMTIRDVYHAGIAKVALAFRTARSYLVAV